jgi:hypothetical protein
MPIFERIQYVNELKKKGNHITIWTARGSNSGIDYSELTKKQLETWKIDYDELKIGKPDYDIYIDDKSWNVDSYWPVPTPENLINNKEKEKEKTKKLPVEIVEKGWGKEIIFVNNDDPSNAEKGNLGSVVFRYKSVNIIIWTDILFLFYLCFQKHR